MLTAGETMQRLAQSDHALLGAYDALLSDWAPDAPPPTLVCSAMAKALLASLDAAERYAAVGSRIEEALQTGDDAAKNAVDGDVFR